jgi:selenocysteine lyase/cysteine desulfurase
MANDTSDASVRRQTSACSSEVPAEEDKQRHRSSCHSLVTFLPHSVFGRIHSFFLDSAPLLPVSRCCAGASCSAVAALVLLSSFWWVRREKQRRGNMSKSQRNAHRASKRKYQARKDRKNDFLDRAGDDYGYRNSPGGHIDTWRSREFPHLIPPMDVVVDDASHLSQDLNQDCSNGIGSKTHSSEPEVYLDYAGAALPSRSQLEGIMSRYATSGALANPHSTGPAASRTMLLIDQAKKLVLDHFNGHPGKSYDIGGANKDTKSAGLGADHHSGYEMIFTSGTTESLRIVAESFRWTSGKKVDDHKSQAGCGHKSMLLYPHNSHTSVVGMRGPAMEKGGTFRCVPLEQLVKATSNDFSECKFDSPKEGDFLKNQSRDHSWRSSHDDESDSQDDETVNHLLALPLECNFGGDRPDNASIAELIRQARRSSIERRTNGPKSQWSVLLDIAKAASTGPVNLRELDPDFACLSFYKVFGEPTGLGVLFVKRSSLHLLEEEHADKNTCTNRYFGGGSVDVVLAGQNFVSPRSEPSVASSFVRGSVHFRGISTLAPGLEELKRVGGMKKVSS